jgi:hypothetical protein
VEHAASKPVDGPDHQDIESSPHCILEHLVECGTLIPTFGSRWSARRQSGTTTTAVGCFCRPASVRIGRSALTKREIVLR